MSAKYLPWIDNGKLIKRRYCCPSDTFLQERIVTLIKENQENVLKEQEHLDKLEPGSLKLLERFHTEFTRLFQISCGCMVESIGKCE